jgi:hypothetical protein
MGSLLIALLTAGISGVRTKAVVFISLENILSVDINIYFQRKDSVPESLADGLRLNVSE